MGSITSLPHELLCPEREEGEHGDGGTHHCFHPNREGMEVCCWCGDIFHADYADEARHGPYHHAGSPVPDDIRAAGWAVAVHNDYRQDGKAHTFWLFTKDGRAIKGEGLTDAEALDQVREAIQHPEGA